MKKRVVTLILCITLSVSLLAIAFLDRKLPNCLSPRMFINGIFSTEISNHDFEQISTNIYFVKEGKFDSLVKHLESTDLTLSEQFGAALIFSYKGTLVYGELISVTKFHNILVLNDPSECYNSR